MYILVIIIIILIGLVYFLNSRCVDESNFDIDEESSPLDVAAVTKISDDSEEKLHKQDLELVAAIMGALSSYTGVPASQLNIKSIKRVDGNNSTWRKTGMLE